ncbi:MAG: helix-hairpin-helix domain-containing protein [Isosphaeraceae bacterium]
MDRVELVVDPNTAPPEVLAALPRLGPTLVGRIEEARSIAPFASLDDLDDRVQGIGPATIPILRPHLRVVLAPMSFTSP